MMMKTAILKILETKVTMIIFFVLKEQILIKIKFSDEHSVSKFKDSSRPKNETVEERKARKKAVKDSQSEKRKSKLKKHIKKRKEKQNTKN